MVDSTDSKAAIAKENSAATTTATVAAMELESAGNAAEAAASETTAVAAVAAVAEAATRVEASATQSVNTNSAQSPQTPSRKRSIESVAVAEEERLNEQPPRRLDVCPYFREACDARGAGQRPREAQH